MNPLFLAVRAVSSEFVRRIYWPIILAVSAVFLALLIFIGWLTTLSGWWWVLLVPIIVCTVLYILLAILVGTIIKLLRPEQTKAQKKDVAALVDKLQDVSDTIQMPKLFVVYQLAKDTIRPSDRGLVTRMTSNASSLKPDFQKIVASFK